MYEGVVVGGWQFIIPAYLITTAVLALYAWSLFARRGRLERKTPDDE